MKNYKLLIAAEYTLLLEKGIPTNWYFDTFTNKVCNTSGAEYSYSEHVFPIIGSTLETHKVAGLLNQENIQQKLQEKEDTIRSNFVLDKLEHYKKELPKLSEASFILGAQTILNEPLSEQQGKWNDQQLESAFEAGIGWEQFCSAEESSSISRFELFKRYLKSKQMPVIFDVEIEMENYYESSMNEQPPLSVRPKLTAAGEILITKILTAWKLTNG